MGEFTISGPSGNRPRIGHGSRETSEGISEANRGHDGETRDMATIR
jgi:hypothetical protein